MCEKEKAGALDTEEGQIFHAYFGAQFAFLSQAVAPFQIPKNLREHVVAVLSQAIVETSETLLITADKLLYRDCAVAARTIFETLVNMLYVLASDESVAQSMVDHANMKLARDLDRTVKSGSATFKIQHEAKDLVFQDPGIQEVLQKYSKPGGDELRFWTKKSIEKRLRAIESAFGSDVALALVFPFENFRFASEVIHGTLYGVLYSRHITILGRPSSPSRTEEHLHQDVFALLLSICTAYGAAAKAIANDELSEEIGRKVSAYAKTFNHKYKKFKQESEGDEGQE